MRPTLAASADLAERLAHPERAFRSVHVTGTKGKGSVCALVEAGLASAGWRVGRYASPHLEVINERIAVDLQPVADDTLAGALSDVLDARDQASREGSAAAGATWFDVMTAAAYLCFARARIDWAVIEVGLGGRLDSTNIIRPDATVITNVGLEHTDVLGNTVEEIAAEKAGIAKAGVPMVTALPFDSPAGRVVRQVASLCASPVRHVRMPLGATISEQNVAIARAVLEALGERGVMSRALTARMSASDLPDRVVARVGLAGRMERFDHGAPSGGNVPVIVDGAHVAFALAEVLRELGTQPVLMGKPTVLLAVGADKDAKAIVAALAGKAALVVCTQTGGARPSLDPRALAALVVAAGLRAELASEPWAGLRRCCAMATGGWVLVTGSLYLAGNVRPHLLGVASSTSR